MRQAHLRGRKGPRPGRSHGDVPFAIDLPQLHLAVVFAPIAKRLRDLQRGTGAVYLLVFNRDGFQAAPFLAAVDTLERAGTIFGPNADFNSGFISSKASALRPAAAFSAKALAVALGPGLQPVKRAVIERMHAMAFVFMELPFDIIWA